MSNDEKLVIPRRFQMPIKYELGKDLSHEKYAQIVIAITDWIREQRPNEKEPGTVVKMRIQECMDGVKKDGSPWFDADRTSLAKRIKAKLRFDIDTMKPLRNANEKTKARRKKERNQRALKIAAKRDDPLLPDAIREKIRKEFSYGDDPNVFKTSAEQREWQRIKDSYTEEFPELSTINGEAELNALCDVHIEMARYRAKRAAQQKFDPEAEASTTKRLVEMKKALGIHPEQLAKRVKNKTAYSVGDAVMRLENMGDDWIKIRDKYALEEFLQIYKMYNTPNADGSSYQLDEVGLFALTRCRPVPCPSCGTIHVFGIPIEMIENWLENRGVIEEIASLEEDDNEVTNQSDGNVQQLESIDTVDSGTEN